MGWPDVSGAFVKLRTALSRDWVVYGLVGGELPALGVTLTLTLSLEGEGMEPPAHPFLEGFRGEWGGRAEASNICARFPTSH